MTSGKLNQDAVSVLEGMCKEKGILLLQDATIEDGDIIFNPEINIAIVGDYIDTGNISVMLGFM